jgi:F-type H+-transporting ATPase subunit gamma
MPSVSEFRRKIRSVKSTQQITKTLKMIAGVRLFKSQKRVADARLYLEAGSAMLASLLSCEAAGGLSHPMLDKGGDGPLAVVAVCADKGLCGSFNENVLAKALAAGKACDRGALYFACGRKAQEYFRRMRVPLELCQPLSSVMNADGLGDFAQKLLSAYSVRRLSGIEVVYSEIKSVIRREIRTTRLVPVDCGTKGGNGDVIFDPSPAELLGQMLPEYVLWKLRLAILESCAAEQAARMNAMDSASRNASELIDSFTLSMNKLRQSLITRELAEIVGTSEALR